MIERSLVSQRLKEYEIQEYITNNLRHVGHSHTKVQRTPLGEKIIIYASRPGLIVGRKGQNIKKLTQTLKKKFKLENPQIEISEVEKPELDAMIVAERIANSLERFGSSRFKGIGHKTMQAVMDSGALGVEIIISGKLPSARAKSWRFYSGYLKKCGDIAITGVATAITYAKLKSGTIGIKVKIMPPDVHLPDRVEIVKEKKEIVEEIPEEEAKKELGEKADEKKEQTEKEEDKGKTEKSADKPKQRKSSRGKEEQKPDQK